MAQIGIALSNEERARPGLVDAAAKAEQAGFHGGWICESSPPGESIPVDTIKEGSRSRAFS